MDTPKPDWELIAWLLGSFGAIFTLLLSAIIYLIYTDKRDSKETLGKHEGWIIEQQKLLHEWGLRTTVAIEQTNTTVELIKQEQAQGWKRLAIFEDHFFKAEKKKR